jgi:hypothetical protein
MESWLTQKIAKIRAAGVVERTVHSSNEVHSTILAAGMYPVGVCFLLFGFHDRRRPATPNGCRRPLDSTRLVGVDDHDRDGGSHGSVITK